MSKILFVHMLGGLRVQIGGEFVSKFRTQKTASLLGYLAFYSQRSHSREELVDRFWPDSEIDAGRTSLRTSLASLRQQLEPPGFSAGSILEADRTFVRLNPQMLETDVTQFEGAWASAARIQDPSQRAEALASAAEIYRGPLLSGHYDDWILQERDRLQQAYTSVLRSAASASRDVGDIQRAIHCLQKLLAVEPLLEEAHLELMKAYAASGNSPAALRQYREQERILRDEMSSTPSAEARELYEQLSRGIVPEDLLDLARAAKSRPQAPLPPPSPAPPAGFVPVDTGIGRARVTDPLPIALTRFFGRDAEIATIQKAIITDKSRLVTLTGPGGSGKTRLAIEAARRIAEKFRGEVAFVPLSDLTDARLIPDAIGEALDIARDKAARPMDQIAEVLRNRRYLLVIDSFEQLVEEGSHTVFTLLERAPTLTCLVTSRQRLDVGGEHELAVEPLPVPTMAGNPDHLSRFASVALFVDRAQSARSGFTLSGENAAAVAAVCERLEGIPLAIELAAAWADILTPAQILARLSHRFDLLSSRRKDLAPRHQTLRAAFDWSYRLLSPEAQRFFTMLSVFRGGWTLEAAEHVCDEPRAMMYLQQLRERSLLIAQESGDEMRFRLLDTLREYAGEQLSDSERDACSERHLEFFESFVKRTAEHLHGPQQSYWLERLEQEYDNSRAALEWVLRNPRCLEIGLRLAGSLSFFWGVRSHVREGRRWFSALLEPIGSADSASRNISSETLAVARHGAGTMAFALGEFADAQSELEQAVALYREAGTRKGEADALTFLGLAREQGDHQGAREALTAARKIYEEIGDDGGLAHALKCLASNAQYLGDVRQARDLIERGLALYRKREDQRGICMMLGELAGLNLAQGEYAQAEETLKEHLELSKELNDMSHTALALENLGKALRGRGDFYVARSYFEQCLAVYRELGNRWGILTAHHNLGIIAMEQGSFRQAEELFDESLRIGREIGEKRSIAAVLGDVGILKHRTGDFATARTNYKASLQAYRELRDRLGESKALRDLGLLALDEGQLDKAEELQNQSLAIAREIGNRHGVAMGLFNVGNIRRHKGDFASARALWEECRVIDRELGIKGGSVLGALGTLAERAGDFARARKLWTASLREHWGIGDRLGAAECLEALADIALGEGEPERSARLHGAADRLRETIGAPLTAGQREMDERRAERLRSSLGDQIAKSLITEGRDLPIDKAVVVALSSSAASPVT